MAVRPFYIDAKIEGRKTNLSGGTAKKDGEHTIDIHQRSSGAITTPYKIRQYSTYPIIDGVEQHKLVTDVYYQGAVIHSHTTDY